MKKVLSMFLAFVSVICTCAFVNVSFVAVDSDELVLQDINYHEVVGRVNQMDAGFTRGDTCIWSSKITEKSAPRNDNGYQFYYIDLGKYSTDAGGKDKDLDDYFLEYLDKSLANLRKNGGTCMVRATYSINGHQRKEPREFEQLLTHQSQLASVFSKYPDVVHLIECGMIGAFGEMWGGKYSSSTYKAQVLSGWLTQLPEEITVNVLTATEYVYFVNKSIKGDGSVVPIYKPTDGIKYPDSITINNFYQYPFYNTIFSRIGCYNDAMIQDGNDGGSFAGGRDNFMKWLSWKALRTNYGGEFSGAKEYRYLHECWLPYNAIPEFYMGHLSYYHGGNNAYAYTGQFKFESKQSRTYVSANEAELRKKQVDSNMELYAGNMPYKSEVSEDGLTVTYTTGGWAAATMDDDFFTFIEENNSEITADLRDYTGASVAQFFEDHVGYRIVLRSSYLNSEVAKGGVLNVKGSLDNTGFANITHNKVTELVITDGVNTYTVATDIDARKWHSAKRSEYDVEIKLPASIPAGEYSVYMRVANKAPDGSTNVANCVRFANAGNSTYNVLGSDYSVGAATIKIIYDSKMNANYIGSFTVTEDTVPGSDDSMGQLVEVEFRDEDGKVMCIEKTLSGGSVTPPEAPTKSSDEMYESYTFVGWYTEDGVLLDAENALPDVYYPRYEGVLRKFEVVFYDAEKELERHNVGYGGSITPPSPEKEAGGCICYTFVGWTDLAGDAYSNFDNITSSLDLYAKYEMNYSHDYEVFVVRDATCSVAGMEEWVCKGCDSRELVMVPTNDNHDYTVNVIREATCVVEGIEERMCNDCSYYELVSTPLGEHSFQDEWTVDKEAGIEVVGSESRHCKNCSEVTDVRDIPALKKPGFNDVHEKGWYYEAVAYAVNKGLFNGTGANTFSPDANMTRAMLVTVLYRMEGSPSVAGITNSFNDVKAGQYYYDAVLWASSNGVVNGVGAGKFAPDANVTREQMATILYRYSEKKGIDVSDKADISAFPDSGKVSSYAKEAIAWANGAGLIGGTNKGGKIVIDPLGNATRAQVATILMRYKKQF